MLALGPMGAQGPEQGMIAARPVCPVDRYAPESLMTIEFSVTNNVFARDILTVAQLNQAVGQLLERSIPAIWVRGEISNFTQAASGHWYFTIKDSRAAVRAVMFRSRASAVGSSLGPATRSRSGRACRCTNRAATTSCRSTPCGGPGWATCTKPSAAQGATGVRGAVRPGAQARAGAAAPAIGVITSLHAPRCAMCCRHWPGARRKFPSSSIRPRCRAPTRPAGWPRKCGWPISAPKWIPCCWCAAAAALKISGASMTRRWRARSRPAPFRWSAAWAMKPTSPSWTSWPTCARPPRPRRRNWPALRAASCWAASWTRRARWRAASSGGWSGPPSASTAPPASWCRRRSAWNISASA